MIALKVNDKIVNLQRGQWYGCKANRTQFLRQVANKLGTNVFYFESAEWLDGHLMGIDMLRYIKNNWHSEISIEEVCQYWEIEPFIFMPIKSYSLGLKQRLILSMYLVSDAHYMVFNQVAVGLEEMYAKKLLHMVKDLVSKDKMVLMSCHYEDRLKENCDVFWSDI